MANKIQLLVFVFLVGMLAACGQEEAIVMVTATAVLPTSISLPPTPTRTPSATATTIPTETPMPTPSATATATTIPTLTPLPTFAAEELETAVADLLANPMNCDVPCWWGATPNETTIFEVQQFLALYQLAYYQRDDYPILDYIELRENENLFDFSAQYAFEDQLLKIVYARQSPPISEILKKYGQPNEVWISTMSFMRETLPVELNLVYLQEGMAVGYVVDGDIIQDDVVKGCFADETGDMSLIAPNSATSYIDFFGIFSLDHRYLLFEEATGLTMEEFMQQFSDPNQPQCIETPTDLWE